MNSLKDVIRESVQRAIFENRYMQIRQMVINEMKRQLMREEKDEDSKETDSNERRNVMNALKDPKYNHAELARTIHHPKTQSEEDTYRSEFSKQARGLRPISDQDIHTLAKEMGV